MGFIRNWPAEFGPFAGTAAGDGVTTPVLKAGKKQRQRVAAPPEGRVTEVGLLWARRPPARVRRCPGVTHPSYYWLPVYPGRSRKVKANHHLAILILAM